MKITKQDSQLIKKAAEEIKAGHAEHTSTDSPPRIYFELVGLAERLNKGELKMSKKELIMPSQPISGKRFVPNSIVRKLLEVTPIDLADIARMDFTEQERRQFYQLIGYSLCGFSEIFDEPDKEKQIVCCETCKHLYEHESEHIAEKCTRYPKWRKTEKWHYCGEHAVK